MTFHAIYEREGGVRWPLSSWDDANHLLSYLKPSGPCYTSFTLSDGSYVQCVGAPRRLTVEARTYQTASTFRHYVFGLGPLSGHNELIECNVGPISVDASQVLSLRHARLIIRHFVECRGLHPTYTATDITSRLGPGA